MIFLLFLGWMALTCFFAYNPGHSWDYYKEFLVTFWVVPIYLYSATNSLSTWKYAMWVSAGSLGVVAAKTGISLSLGGGSPITESISGFVGDNNVFGLTLCLALACIMGLRGTMKAFRGSNYFFFPLVAMVIMCIIYTKSRGAFLSMGLIFISSAVLSKKVIRNSVALILVIIVGYLVIPSTFFDRLHTLENIEEDDSAMSRIFYWKLSWLEALANPLFGIGLNNDLAYNEAFHSQEMNGRVNHAAQSVYCQIIAQTGFVGLAFYLLLCAMTLIALQRAHDRSKMMSRMDPEFNWVTPLTFWMRNGFLAYMFGSALLNMLVFDFPWYFMFFSNMLGPLLDAEYARKRKATLAS